jgi:hypothetical protein
MKGPRHALLIILTCAFVALPSIAFAYCQAVLRNPFNGSERGRFPAPTCKEAVAKCMIRAHGPQRCYIVSGYENWIRNPTTPSANIIPGLDEKMTELRGQLSAKQSLPSARAEIWPP